MRKSHSDHIVPIEQWHPQFPDDPVQPCHFSGIIGTIGSPIGHNGIRYYNEEDEKLKKRAETQENMKFHFQAPLMLVQKFPRHLSTLSTIKLVPEQKIRFFKNFVQRRWVYSVAEATS